jgi:hypothetical protein
MTDTTAGAAQTEAVAAVAPEAAPEAIAPPAAPSPDESNAALLSAEAPEVETEVVGSFDPRISIPESLGPVRRAILEGLIDSEGPMSVSQLHACMPPGTSRSTAEASILREFRSGRIERVAPGTYRLAPPPKPKPPPPPPDEEQMWFDALEAWLVDSSTWDIEKLGPPPDHADIRVPPPVKVKFVDRIRKRQERRREAEAAAARRAAADRELRDKLIAATGGNVIRGPGIEDVAPIKLALEVVPLERILSSIRCKTDRKLYPKNEPATSWRDPVLLKDIAENYCRTMIVPRLVAGWSAAGRAPQKPTDASEARAGTQEPAAHHVAGVGRDRQLSP